MTYRVRSTDIWHSMPGVVAAYQPIGAPSEIEARFNIGMYHRMVGNYTATPGTAPAFNPATGWGVVTASKQYLKSGVVPINNQTWSAIVSFSNALVPASTICCLLGFSDTGNFAEFALKAGTGDFTNKVRYSNGNFNLAIAPALTSGVIGLAGNQGYRNGIVETGTISTLAGTFGEIYIGARNFHGTADNFSTVTLKSILICQRVLTAAEVWQASMQMAYCDANPAWNAWAPRRRYWQIPIEAPAPVAAPAVIGLYRPRSNDVWHSMPGVVAAYQPIGAPSDVEARFNIGAWQSMVGNYSAAPGTAPTWNAATGWTFNGSSQYFDTVTVPANDLTYSALVSYKNASLDGNRAVWGGRTGGEKGFGIAIYWPGRIFWHGSVSGGGTSASSGVVALAGAKGYFNGISEATTATGTYSSFVATLGGIRTIGSTPTFFFKGNITSVLIVSRTLTAAEVWQASMQMAYCDVRSEWNAWAPRKRYFIPASAAAGSVGIYGARATVALPGGVSIRATGGNT